MIIGALKRPDSDEVVLQTPDPVLLERLLPVARRMFTDTFAHLYDIAAFEQFCDEVYNQGGSMSTDFGLPEVRWQIAMYDHEPIGYAKLTPLRAPSPDPAQRSLEMQQLYVVSEWHGTGVANRLASWAVETALAEEVEELYLTVFDHNERAKRFYTRLGFVEIGRCTFQLGERIDDDRIWCLLL